MKKKKSHKSVKRFPPYRKGRIHTEIPYRARRLVVARAVWSYRERKPPPLGRDAARSARHPVFRITRWPCFGFG